MGKISGDIRPGRPVNRRAFLKASALLSTAAAVTACERFLPAGAPGAQTLAPDSRTASALPGDQPPTVAPTASGALPGAPESPTAAATETHAAQATLPSPSASPPATSPPATPQPATPQPAPVALEILALNRLAFGPRPDDLQAFRALPGNTPEEQLEAYIEQQLTPEGLEDADCQARLAAAGFETLAKTPEQLWDDHILNNPYDDSDERHWQWYELPVKETYLAAFLRAVYSRRQLFELLVDFWHNHFNVYGWHEAVAPLFASYDRDVIRPHALGNFRQMLEAVSSHPSMLYYLDNYTNSDAGPNENFARELFELHTLGAENYLGVRDPRTVPGYEAGAAQGYVDNDVYEAARCFTGWRVDDDRWEGENDVGQSGRFLYYRPWHDRFNKVVLGRYLPADQPDQKDGRDVLDILAAHPGTANYISRKLCRRFLSDDPPEEVVQAAAAAFLAAVDAPDQLRQVLHVILRSDAFRLSWGQKVKRPFEAAAAMLRALQADFSRISDGLRWTYEMMGQPLFGRHTPDGYPDRQEAWATTMSLLYRWNFAIGVVENWFNDEETQPAIRIHVNVWDQTPGDVRSPQGLADYWIERLLGRSLPEPGRQAIIGYLAQDVPPDADLSEEQIQALLPGAI